MKCFAARQKDVVHARVLVRDGANLEIVVNQFNFLEEKKIPGVERAKEFFAEVEAFFAAKEDEE